MPALPAPADFRLQFGNSSSELFQARGVERIGAARKA